MEHNLCFFRLTLKWPIIIRDACAEFKVQINNSTLLFSVFISLLIPSTHYKQYNNLCNLYMFTFQTAYYST